MVSTTLLVLLVLFGLLMAYFVHFHLVGKEPSPFELRDEHIARMETNIPVEGPAAKAGKREQGRRTVVLTDRRLVIFRWGKERVVDVPHELGEEAPLHPSGHRLALEIRHGGHSVGRPGLYLIYTEKPSLWAAEIRRWRSMVADPEADAEEFSE